MHIALHHFVASMALGNKKRYLDLGDLFEILSFARSEDAFIGL